MCVHVCMQLCVCVCVHGCVCVCVRVHMCTINLSCKFPYDHITLIIENSIFAIMKTAAGNRGHLVLSIFFDVMYV